MKSCPNRKDRGAVGAPAHWALVASCPTAAATCATHRQQDKEQNRDGLGPTSTQEKKVKRRGTNEVCTKIFILKHIQICENRDLMIKMLTTIAGHTETDLKIIHHSTEEDLKQFNEIVGEIP